MKTRTPEKESTQEPSGQRAALFPALSEGSKEKRAVSILLACMEQVPELARTLLQGQGAPLGKKSRLKAWTEAGPIAKKGSDRPDGRIEVESTRGQMWVALLEAKIGKASLESPQIEAYLAQSPRCERRRSDHHLERLRGTRESPSDLPREDPQRDDPPALVVEFDPHEMPTADRWRRNRGSGPSVHHRAPGAIPQPPEHRRDPLRPDAGKLEGHYAGRCGRRRHQEGQ